MHTIYFQDVSNSDFRPISLEWPIYIKVWGQQYIDSLIYWFIYLCIWLIDFDQIIASFMSRENLFQEH